MENGTDNDIIFRDGTSQRSRMVPALDPAYFSVEEHSTEDLLRFAQKFAVELKFYILNNEVEGDWSGFLGSKEDIADILAFLKNPNAFDHDPARKAWLTRPHLSLFLQFLEMLKEPKTLFDDLTRRHLEFYYRDVLRFGPKPWKADRVHVLFEPAKGVESVVIPKGTLLQAGKDGKGKFLHYQTLHELVVNQARVVDVRTTFRGDPSKVVKLFAATAWQEGQKGSEKFQAFGTDLTQTYLSNNPSYARVGFAIESPLLWLSGGNRYVYLILPKLNTLSNLGNAFIFEMSCGEGKWHRFYPAQIENQSKLPLEIQDAFADSWILKCEFSANENIPEFLPPSGPSDHEYRDFKHPVLRAVLDQTTADYHTFSALQLERLGIFVEVDSLDKVKCRNDQAVLNPKAPVEPFGTYPQKESTFTFSHPELCNKSLNSVFLNVEWRGKHDKDRLSFIYNPYEKYLNRGNGEGENKAIINTDDFVVELIDNTPKSISAPISLYTNSSFNSSTLNLTGYYSNLPDSDDPNDYPRYFGLKLKNDLFHSIYPQVLQWCATGAGKAYTPVEAPYTPFFQSFRVGYTAQADILKADTVFYHIHPFGISPAPLNHTDQNSPNTYSLLPNYPASGCLYVGIDTPNPPADLSLLFQMWPGMSEQVGLETKAVWSYLEDNVWKTLNPNDQILYDATDRLFRTGLMRLRLPKVTSLEHRLMPAGLYWLRAAADANFARAAGDFVAIHAQATEAEFTNRDNTLEHLQRPLPPDSIKNLVSRDPKIKSILQPYTSFGGRPEEAPERLYTRVSERLRHKQRALSAWDYERLVLEEFPEVYKVKCLLPWEQERLAAYDPASGAITLVVIPDISNTAPFFPIEPQAPLSLMDDIKTFLQSHAPAFARITVKNPRYEPIRYRMDIRFHRDYDPAICLYEAQEALKQYLSPWAYQEGADIPFGSRVYHSELIYLLENLAFVDYVLNFKLVLHQLETEVRQGCLPPALWVGPSRPDAVLVTHVNHIIWPIFDETKSIVKYKGIGYDIIGVDQKVYSTI